MKLSRLAACGAFACMGASAWSVDLLTPQINLDVKFLTTSIGNLDDLGIDWGFGLGLSMDLPTVPLTNYQPFVKAEYQRQEGDNDLETESYGIAGGVKLPLTPKVTVVNSVNLYLSIGYYETKAQDVLFSEKKKGTGFDVGVQTKLPLLGSLPVISVLFTRRPKTFGEDTDNLVIMLSSKISGGN